MAARGLVAAGFESADGGVALLAATLLGTLVGGSGAPLGGAGVLDGSGLTTGPGSASLAWFERRGR